MNQNTNKLSDIIKKSLQEKIEDVIPGFRKKNVMTDEQIEKIINTLAALKETTPERALIAMMMLFLQGAASAGAPVTMSVDLGEGKTIEKKTLITACENTMGHKYIRRIAEALASQIGEFAAKNKLPGELAYRINNRYKAETGNNLTDIEMAYCSSFSQCIPNLAEITSENLVKLLAKDYQIRFENKKKVAKTEQATQPKSKKKAAKRKR